VADSITPSISSGSRASTASALALARGNPPDRFLRYVGIEVTFRANVEPILLKGVLVGCLLG
jgi:hypothetical protein